MIPTGISGASPIRMPLKAVTESRMIRFERVGPERAEEFAELQAAGSGRHMQTFILTKT